MYSILTERPTEWEVARVYPISDLHVGDPNCNMAAISSHLNKIQKDPNALVVLNGDLMNTATRTSVSDVYGETLRPSEQLTECSRLLAPIADKIIGVTCGNHENRIYKNDGVDMMRLLSRELGVEDRYSPEGVLMFVRFGIGTKHGSRATSKRCYSIYATHGAGGGRKEGGKINRLADLAGIVDADIYIHSHTHLPAYFAEDFFRTDIQNAKAVKVTKGFLNTPAALNYGGYGEAQGFKPASICFPFVELSGRVRDFRVVL